MSKRKKVVVRVATVLISFAVACFSAGVTLISTGLVEQQKINNQCKVSYTSKYSFAKANGQQYAIQRVQPCKGTLQVQLCQTAGKSGTQYTVYVKKSNTSSYKKVKTFTCKNNTATSYVNLVSTKNSSTKYDVKVVKTNNTKNASKLTVKYMLK